MHDLAVAVGVRTPSLYRRFKDRASIVAAVELRLLGELTSLLGKSIIANDPEATLLAQAQAIRRFAKRKPRLYALLFDIGSVPSEEGDAARAAAVEKLLPSLAALAGDKSAFAAARVLVPFLHGFISMELANAFRLGGGVDAAFVNGVSVILRGAARGFDREG